MIGQCLQHRLRAVRPVFQQDRQALFERGEPIVLVTGVAFDPTVLRRQIRQANRRLVEIEREADAVVSAVPGAKPASLASSADVSRVLFEDLKLPPPPCALLCKSPKSGVM